MYNQTQVYKSIHKLSLLQYDNLEHVAKLYNLLKLFKQLISHKLHILYSTLQNIRNFTKLFTIPQSLTTLYTTTKFSPLTSQLSHNSTNWTKLNTIKENHTNLTTIHTTICSTILQKTFEQNLTSNLLKTRNFPTTQYTTKALCFTTLLPCTQVYNILSFKELYQILQHFYKL